MRTEAVVLLHGLWMKSVVMRPMAAMIRQHGYQTHCFSYRSMACSPVENARLLRRYCERITAPTVHFVGHSLGGRVILHYFNGYADQPPGRVVLLGTPLAGSDYAALLYQKPLTRKTLGRSVEHGLLEPAEPWRHQRALGVIAGTRPLGVGSLIGRNDAPSDGAVLLSETRLEGLTDHTTLPVSHSGMLFSRRVVCQIDHFLQHGRFSTDC